MTSSPPDRADHGRRIVGAVERARAHAPFLAMVLEREPALAATLAAGDFPSLNVARDDEASLSTGTRLRRERRRMALLVAIGDLAGLLDFQAVTRALSDFADRALDEAIASALRERHPDSPAEGIAAIALGKQGSRELNYSSDIDPILLFDPATLPRRPREEPVEAAVRIGRRVVELLQARDADGYVLRVDLRLRPSPEVSPIVLPVDAAISYYESQALAWERAAFIRARAAAGDQALGQRFLTAIRPFVWRRGLDFGAIGEIRDISRRIRDHHAQGQAFGPGYDLKRGRGGIREVEFFAQILQLIHGGRDARLRTPATLDALAALADAGWLGAPEAIALADAYRLFRTLEHRVQMVDDRQTHSLPTGAALDHVAQLHGLDDGTALLDLLRPHVERVATIYDSLATAGSSALAADPVRIQDQLTAMGFADVDAAVQRIAGWRSGRYPALRSAAARAALEDVLPSLLAAFGAAPDPGGALNRLDTMLSRLPSAINFFRLMQAQPALARLTATVLAQAPTLADELARRPALLDGLIDATALAPMGSIASLAAEMRTGEAGGDYQALLDRVRQIVGEKRFALGAQVISGAGDPLEVAGGYARVAEAAVEVLARATVEEFAARHGRVPDSELVILALGRMGGAALTHASDLDLIYLFTGDYSADSDGEKPLGAVLYYNRLAQRVSGALSVPTQAGPLYPIDTRLRPSGTQGPLAVSLDAFARYQRESAWTWEHMALTRARPIFGSDAARSAVRGVVRAVLAGDRRHHDVAADARKMRLEMAAHKPPMGPVDAKLLPGGLVDLEFAVHTLQLLHRTGFASSLGDAIPALAREGLLPAELLAAHNFLTRLLVTVRLIAPDGQAPAPAAQALVARALELESWGEVLATLDVTRQEVSRIWQQVSRAGDGTGRTDTDA